MMNYFKSLALSLLLTTTLIIQNASAGPSAEMEDYQQCARAKAVKILGENHGVIWGKVKTEAGHIAYMRSPGTEGTPLLFLHGNSTCKETFLHQFAAMGQTRPLVAIDTCGHGESDDASNSSYYSFKGMATVIKQTMDQLGLDKVVLCGWSMGGHYALDVAAQFPDRLAGLVITGTPPIEMNMEGMLAGFNDSPIRPLISKQGPLTEKEAELFMASGGFDVSEAELMVKAGMRTTGEARAHMVNRALAGEGVDERALVAKLKIPFTIIRGLSDGGVNNGYIARLTFSDSFRGLRDIEKGPHAIHWSNPEDFNRHLQTFLRSIRS